MTVNIAWFICNNLFTENGPKKPRKKTTRRICLDKNASDIRIELVDGFSRIQRLHNTSNYFLKPSNVESNIKP